MAKRGLLTRVVVATLIGLALALLLLRTTGSADRAVREILYILSRTRPSWVAWGALLFLVSQAARALRWKVVTFRRELRLGLLLPLTAVHIGLGHVLPVRLSDVAYVALARRLGSLPVGDGTASVALSKLLDLMAMGLVVAGAASLSIPGSFSYLAPLGVAVAGGLGIALLPSITARIRA
ncbi:flippase-like domain-containing protein, partial [Candidatus Fermentibacterales bacterium]|nr:flippase-like domain-containing protein [Candidatus Fermentibacterales bacterium]